MATLTINFETETKEWQTDYDSACTIAQQELDLTEEEHWQIWETGEVETQNGKAVVEWNL
jgi:hypothetical protein